MACYLDMCLPLDRKAWKLQARHALLAEPNVGIGSVLVSVWW